MMTDRSVLEKVINKALKNGMSPSVVDNGTFYQVYAMVKTRTGNTQMANGFSPEDCYGLIFSHEFAKGFWGEEEIKIPPPPKGERRAYVVACDWKYHLQKMVLEENPVDYLRKFIEEDEQD